MKRILIVDDVMADRRLVGGLLTRGGEYEVVEASNGREALTVFDDDSPDLVLTDLQMPELDGLQLVGILKEHAPRIPVVLMTGRGSEEIAFEAIAAGAASYVPKRALTHDLVDTIRRVLNSVDEAETDRLMMQHLEEISYVMENDTQVISTLVMQLRRMFRDMELLNESDCLRVSNAILEALQNAYFHGNLEVSSELREQEGNAYQELADERRQIDPYRDRRIRFRMRIDDEYLHFKIGDDGPGFNADALPNPTDPEFFERPHGRGVFLMKAFMDSVSFNSRGNEVTLVKSRSTEPREVVESAR
ncbi:response regulator [Calycomorphotria hydatis]|uniref:Chemotaxis protein CheY n=1 Tax=Calycomorphotria hydatis TaxID=2528027 RepID=A0A517TEH7_9PLAN|nr:response regulator [Calycomorphotria hydatis]QDT66769.1 Chemotaxis protein CheY [Calycomorphotria hydatis]